MVDVESCWEEGPVGLRDFFGEMVSVGCWECVRVDGYVGRWLPLLKFHDPVLDY